MQDIVLGNGKQIPALAFGTYKIPDVEAERCVANALQAGYRHIDTATIYQNECGVGRGIRVSGVSRENIFLTTKLWKDDTRKGCVRSALFKSLEMLGTDYVDLYLMHWPVEGHSADAWHEMEGLCREGYARSIGVSNFHRQHLDALLEIAEIKPVVNQIELHPMLSQPELSAFCRSLGIAVECHRPIGGSDKSDLREHHLIREVAARYCKSPAQIMLRWSIQKGNIVLVKSLHEERMIENLQIFDFELSEEDMLSIDKLDCNWRVGSDPDKMGF